MSSIIQTGSIREIYASKAQLHKLFFAQVPVGLWRLHSLEDIAQLRDVLMPVLQTIALENGRSRSADIKVYSMNGLPYVEAGTGGVSLFDKPADLPKSGHYYYAAQGVEIPKGLAISEDKYRDRWKATHYTIHPEWNMPVYVYLQLLRVFARCFAHVASTISRTP